MRAALTVVLLMLLVVTLFIPLIATSQSSFVVEPSYVQVRGFVGLPITVQVRVRSLSGNDTLDFRCEGNYITPPPNGTQITTIYSNLTFQVNASTQYSALVTCYLLSSDDWRAVTFDIIVDRYSGGISLSSSRISISQEAKTVRSYSSIIYAYNKYNFSSVEIRFDMMPSWFSVQNIVLNPRENKPLSFTVNTNDLFAGSVYYGSVYYSYYVDGTKRGSGSFDVVLNVTPKAVTPTPNYVLTVQTVDADDPTKPVQNAAIFISSSTDSIILFTDATGSASRLLPSANYQIKVKAVGYQTYETSLFLDRNLSRVFLLQKEVVENQTNQTTTVTPGVGSLRILAYNVTITVGRGLSNSASIPLLAVGGQVVLQVTDVASQPEWIKASLSSNQLMEGQTGFLVVTATPPNMTSLGNYTKQFYLAYNNQVALITAKVSVIQANVTKTVTPIYNQSYQRPTYLRVPIVSVILRGTEGVTTTQPVKCKLGDTVYVVVQGDYNLVRVKPNGLALLGAEPRVDGVIYRYQVKENNAMLSIDLVYVNPITGLESTERPEEYGYGNYRFEVIENPEAVVQRSAVLVVTIGDGSAVADTSQILTCSAYIYYANGTKTAYEGEITFQPNYKFANTTLTPAVSFTAGFGTINFKYSGTYIPQKPAWWNGDFRVNPMQIEVRSTVVDWKDMRSYTSDDMITYDLSELGIDVYHVSVLPKADWSLEGSILRIKPEPDTAYTVIIEGFIIRNFQNVQANRDVTLRITTGKVVSGTSTVLWSFGAPLAATFLGFVIFRFVYVNLKTRRAKRPWEG
ncbi:MAG: hypothetical protein QXP84_07495 [Candidatus Korarchaeum sp.]